MKKKSVFNNNEVDIDLLVNQPKHIRKLLGKKKDKNEEDEVEEDEDNEGNDTKSISPQMKRYIEEYIDSKKVKKKERPENFMVKAAEKINGFIDESYDNAKKSKKDKDGIIESYLKRKFSK